MADDAPLLTRLAEETGQLYSLPMVAVEVLRLTNHPKVDTRALKACIENDPALTGKILRVVNSSLFGLSREVVDLNQALALLGTKALKLLVLGFSLPDKLFVGIAGDILRRYWHRTLLKAIAAREISEQLYQTPGDEPFIAGLLQDLGMLVLIQQLGAPYIAFLDRALAKANDLRELEQRSLGFDHVDLSARMLKRWGLPDPIVQAIAARGTPEAIGSLPKPRQAGPQMLHLADLLASLLSENRVDLLAELLEAGRRYHRLTHADVSNLVNRLQEKVDQLADVLSLELPQGRDYAEVLAAAHAQLAEVAMSAAADLLQAQRQEETLLGELEALTAAVEKTVHAAAPATGRPASARREQAAAAARSASPAVLPSATEDALPPIPVSGRDTEPFSAVRATRVAVGRDDCRHPAARGGSPRGDDVDPGLLGRIGSAAAACRQGRCPLSLVLLEVDRFDELLLTQGPEQAQRLMQLLEAACRRISPAGAICVPARDARLALILAGCERSAAVDLAQHLLRAVRTLAAPAGSPPRAATTISVGVASVALPPKNFAAEDLVAAADRCLGGASLCGGNAVKSIEIY